MAFAYYEVDDEPDLPITVAEAKAWLRVAHSLEDTIIEDLIKTAAVRAESHCNLQFMLRTVTGYFEKVEMSRFEPYPFISFTKAPLKTVTGVWDISGTSPVEITDYQIKKRNDYPRFLLTGNYPTVPGDDGHLIKITATVGYGTAADVPADIKTAMKRYIAANFMQRGDLNEEVKFHYAGKHKMESGY